MKNVKLPPGDNSVQVSISAEEKITLDAGIHKVYSHTSDGLCITTINILPHYGELDQVASKGVQLHKMTITIDQC